MKDITKKNIWFKLRIRSVQGFGSLWFAHCVCPASGKPFNVKKQPSELVKKTKNCLVMIAIAHMTMIGFAAKAVVDIMCSYNKCHGR